MRVFRSRLGVCLLYSVIISGCGGGGEGGTAGGETTGGETSGGETSGGETTGGETTGGETTGSQPVVNIPPTAPPRFQVNNVREDFINLGWEASTDSDGTVTNYDISRDGVMLARLSSASREYDDIFTPTPGATYNYSIKAIDDDGADSPASNDSVSIPSCKPEILSLKLWDVELEQSTKTFSGGLEVIDAGEFIEGMNVVAEATDCTESVYFSYTGTNGSGEKLENNFPYAIGPNQPGRIGAWKENLILGRVTLSVTPYSDNDKNGIEGATLTARLDLSDSCLAIRDLSTEGYDYLSAKYSFAPEANLRGYDDKCANTFYYETVDPEGRKTTIDDWLRFQGFLTSSAPSVKNKINRSFLVEDVVNGEYQNMFDLGLGRDMYCRPNASSYPCIVQNYKVVDDFDLTRNGTSRPELLLSVAMEKQGEHTAFYVYDNNGRRINSVDLDGRGEKRVPEVCLGCHDGDWTVADFGTFRVGTFSRGEYLPFDHELFKSFDRDSTIYRPIASFRPAGSNYTSLNKLIRPVVPTNTVKSDGTLRETESFYVIEDTTMYLGHSFTPSFSFGSGTVFRQSNATFPLKVFDKYCRTCHISQTGDTAIFAQSPKLGANCSLCHDGQAPTQGGRTRLKSMLCDSGTEPDVIMPNARTTHSALFHAVNGTAPYGDSDAEEFITSLCSSDGIRDPG